MTQLQSTLLTIGLLLVPLALFFGVTSALFDPWNKAAERLLQAAIGSLSVGIALIWLGAVAGVLHGCWGK